MSRRATLRAAVGPFGRARRGSEVPVVLCIDVEPDPRQVDRREARPWLGFERLLELLPALRRRLSDATGAPAAFTWFLRMDPQVAETWDSAAWVAEAHGDALAELAADGDELGLHTHLWRWQREKWISDHADPTWAEHCVTTGLDAFELAFDRACGVHRGGDHFLSGQILSCLEDRGVKIDLTVEAGEPPEAPSEEHDYEPGPD